MSKYSLNLRNLLNKEESLEGGGFRVKGLNERRFSDGKFIPCFLFFV